jgi:epoxide hydrolase-like predicted phosphatase
MTNKIKILLFDLGGVIVEFSGVKDISSLLRISLSENEIREKFNNCPHIDAFGRGKISQEEFGERFVRDWGINLTPEIFLEEFRSWSKCILPGAEEILELLRPQYRLAALSNSNELHWDRNTNDLGVTGLFEIAISSHQIGLCKPEPAIYYAFLDRINISPDAIMFFDDVKENVESAKNLGMSSFQVHGVQELRELLKNEQFIR